MLFKCHFKTVWYCYKKRHIDQWKRIEGPEINPHIYGQLIYNEEAKNIQWEKGSFLNKWCWENSSHLQKFYTIHENYSKKIKNIKVGPQTIKLLEGNRW